MWEGALSRVLGEVDELGALDQGRVSRSPALARERAGAVLASAHARMLVALAAGCAREQDAARELLDAAVALMRVLPLLWSTHTVAGYDDRFQLIGVVLERQLSAHEHGVLSGELTYSLTLEEVDPPAVRMRRSLAELAMRDSGCVSDLISVQLAAINLAALLVRGAGNILTNACVGQAPERLVAAHEPRAARVVREIAARGEARTRAAGEQVGVLGHHLALAVRACAHGSQPAASAGDPRALPAAREAWLELAVLEHVIVAALGAKLPAATDRPDFETVAAALTEGARSVLSDARLSMRAGAFRHEEAWRRQRTALTHAREIYLNGLPGASDALQRAHEIVSGRLVRAIVAITLIDLCVGSPNVA